MTTTNLPRLISNMRGVRYGEVLAAFARDGGLQAEDYGTQMLNDSPQELCSTLGAAAVAIGSSPGTTCDTSPRRPALRFPAAVLWQRTNDAQAGSGVC